MDSYAHDLVRVKQLVDIGDENLDRTVRNKAFNELSKSVNTEVAAGCTTFTPLALDCYVPDYW